MKIDIRTRGYLHEHSNFILNCQTLMNIPISGQTPLSQMAFPIISFSIWLTTEKKIRVFINPLTIRTRYLEICPKTVELFARTYCSNEMLKEMY